MLHQQSRRIEKTHHNSERFQYLMTRMQDPKKIHIDKEQIFQKFFIFRGLFDNDIRKWQHFAKYFSALEPTIVNTFYELLCFDKVLFLSQDYPNFKDLRRDLIARIDELTDEDHEYHIIAETFGGHLLLCNVDSHLQDHQDIINDMMEIGDEINHSTNKELIKISEDLFILIWETVCELKKRMQEAEHSKKEFSKHHLRQIHVKNGDIWILTTQEEIMHWKKGRWEKLTGKARQIAVGSSRKTQSGIMIWSIDEKNNLYRYDSLYSRKKVDSNMVRISIADDANFMAIDEEFLLWQRLQERWVPRNVHLSHISINESGMAWGIDRYNRVWRLNTEKIRDKGKDWIFMEKELIQLNVNSHGVVTGVDQGGLVHEWSEEHHWTQVHTKEPLRYAIRDGEHIWGITMAGELFHSL
jgi:hypothetical protein